MAWPDTSLVAEVTLELNASLTADPTTYTFATDITSLTFDRDGDSSIVIRRGRQDEQFQSPPSTCDLTVDNTDGRFSPRNPVGTYYPNLRRNTPVRVRVNPGTGLATRYVGYVSEWPPRWDASESDFNVPVRANGVLRRLGQGATPLKSAMFRRVLSPDEPTPVAYWPCEDGTASTAVASGLPGSNAPMIGTPVFSAGFGGTAGSVDLNAMTDGALTGSADLTANTGFQVEFMATSDAASDVLVMEVLSGTLDVNIQLGASARDGQPHHTAVKFVQNGANVDVTSYRDGALVGTSSTSSSVIGSRVSVVTRHDGQAIQLAHIAIYDPATMNAPTTRGPAATAYAGEVSGTRFARLCTEENVADNVAAGSTEAMGPQTLTTLLDLLRECEAAEEGLIVERADGRLGFDPHSVRENQSVALTLNYASQHVSPPLEPTDDDQRIRNDVTVTRTGGTSKTVLDQSGPVGITAVGRYDEGVDLNLYTDDQPYNHAGWRVNLGTVDGLRFPTVTVNLRRNNSLTASFLALDIGDRIKITNLPDIISFDDVDLIVEGYTEQISQKNWIITFNCAPYRPYKVFTLANTSGDTGEFLGRLLPDTMSLAVARDTTQTSWTVATNPVFTTASDDYPISLRAAGEKITATAVSTVNDAFTRSVTDAWGTATSGQSYTLNGTAADFDVSGTVGTIQPTTTGSRRLATVSIGSTDFDVQIEVAMNATPASGSNTVGVLGRHTDSNNYLLGRIDVSTAGVITLVIEERVAAVSTNLASLISTSLVHANNVFKTIRFRADGTALKLKVWNTGTTEPVAWSLTADDAGALTTGTNAGAYGINNTAVTTHVFSYDNLLVQNPVVFTVTRSVNGVSKSQVAGASIEIDEPAVLAL